MARRLPHHQVTPTLATPLIVGSSLLQIVSGAECLIRYKFLYTGFIILTVIFQASILILRTFFMYNFCFMVQWGYSLPGFRHDALQVVICWPRCRVFLSSSILTSLVEFCVICIVLNVGHHVVVVVFMCVLTRESSEFWPKAPNADCIESKFSLA